MKQITEDYVSFEVAKLLKEKEFDELCFALYNPEEELIQCGVKLSNTQVGRVPGSYSAPTHQMAFKWLRKVHKIILDIAFEANQGWTFYIGHLITKTLSDGSTIIVDVQHSVWSEDVQQPYYKEYEQAVEAALKYTLENLI